MFFISLFSRVINSFALWVLFQLLYPLLTFTHCYLLMHACQSRDCNDVLVVVYDKTWENWVMLSLHGQLVLDIWTRCWPRVLKLTCLWLVNFQHPRSTSLLNIQHYMLLTQWITLQYIISRCCAEGVMTKWPVIYSGLAILRKKILHFHICVHVITNILTLTTLFKILQIQTHQILKGYSLSHDQEALDIRQRCWQRVLNFNIAPLVNIKAKYPALAGHEEIPQTDIPTFCFKQL